MYKTNKQEYLKIKLCSMSYFFRWPFCGAYLLVKDLVEGGNGRGAKIRNARP